MQSVAWALGFSALQRAEIAEMRGDDVPNRYAVGRFSALQRAEIAEIGTRNAPRRCMSFCFSALQRAEIAEIRQASQRLLLLYL